MGHEQKHPTNEEDPGEPRFGVKKIQDTFIVIAMATATPILTAVILESFLKIPVTEVTPHVIAAVGAAIVGIRIGLYLNTLD